MDFPGIILSFPDLTEVLPYLLDYFFDEDSTAIETEEYYKSASVFLAE